MMDGSCCFCGTGCRSEAMATPLASSDPARCEAVLHGYETRPLEGGVHQFATVCTHGNFIVLPHWNTRPPAPLPDIPLSRIILTLREPFLALS